MELPDFLNRWPNGEIVLKGHRIGLCSIVELVRRGQGPDAIHDEFPSLEPSLIQKVVDFYGHHRAGSDAYVDAYQTDLERQAAASRPGPGVLRVHRLMAERASGRQP